ncbi:MAG: hypothetical protein Aurels2KO_15380 [Aureliella sp.]
MTALAVTLDARLIQVADVKWLVSHPVVANLHAATHVVQLQLAVAKSLHAATLAALLQPAVAKSLHVATLAVQLLAVAAKSLHHAVATADAASLAVVH